MNPFFSCIENALHDYAVDFTPEGSEPKAVAHQWVHAIAYNHELFAQSKGADKTKVIKHLKQAKCYTNAKAFKQQLRENINFNPVEKPKFTFIDLFAGIGGMRLGFESAGGACVFSSEFDKFAQDTYFANYGEHPFGDITLIDEENIPNHDVLLAGFPCQPFSYAGRCEGFEDQTRGTLFFDVLKVAHTKKPKIILLENVKGFKSHQSGETMRIAIKALEELGYIVRWQVLNSYDFGLPQYRERWYCVATRKQEISFPKGKLRGSKLKDIIENDNNDDSLRLTSFELKRIKYHFENASEVRVQHDHSAYAPHTKKGRHGVFSFQKADGALRFHIGDIAKTQIQEAFYACLDTYAPTIIANRTPKLWDIERKLSVLESCRLQGFPDSFIFQVSNAQAYKQLGNSVSIPVIKALANSVRKIIIGK